jgi:hypothetical protein
LIQSRFLRRRVVLGLIVPVITLACLTLHWSGVRLFRDRVAELRAAGEPVRLIDLQRPPVADEQNAAAFLREIQPELDALSRQLFAVESKPSAADGRIDAADLETIAAVFAAHPRFLSVLKQAAACPDYDPRPNLSGGPQVFVADSLARVQNLRAIVRHLNLAMHEQLATGRWSEAFETTLLMLRLGRHFTHEPLLMGYLAAAACQTVGINAARALLESGPLSQGEHAALDQELALQDQRAPYLQALKSERAIGLESYRNFGLSGHFVFGGDRNQYLDQIAAQLDTVEHSAAEARNAELKQIQSGTRKHPIANLAADSLRQSRKTADRTTARLRSLRVLNALIGRAAMLPEAPPSITTLGLPASATLDPYTGSNLHLKRSAGSWIVYAAGENLQDDDGVFDPDLDVGLSARIPIPDAAP